MYNYFILIGRVVNDAEIKELSDGRKVINITLACKRPFKNYNGEYETDFFKISLWEFVAEVAFDKLKKGVSVGIKGRLITKKEVLENGYNITLNELIGERVILIDSKHKRQKESDDIEDDFLKEENHVE